MTIKLAQTDQTLLIVNCAKSWQEVIANQVYICPAQGASYNFRPARYFGVYHNLTVSHVANIEAVIDVDEQHNTSIRWLAGGGAEAGYRARAVEKAIKLRPQAEFPVRVILLDYLQATGFKKGSRGGMQNSKQYLDVSSVGVTSAGYLAGKLWDKNWSDFRAITEASLAASETDRKSFAGMYIPLQNWFVNQTAEKKELELSFPKIEEIIGISLPPSAREYEAWWLDKSENTTHSHARPWLETGWQVAKLDLTGEKVSFKRV